MPRFLFPVWDQALIARRAYQEKRVMTPTETPRSEPRMTTTQRDEASNYVDRYHGTEKQYLGRHGSFSFAQDPRHLVFALARYKFVAKMLQAYTSVLEVGCGDGFGSTIVAQAVQRLTCVDFDACSLEQRADNVWLRQKAKLLQHDITVAPLHRGLDE
jgi:methylase of polypeptide subunit release factors